MQQPANPYRSPDATVADRGTAQRYGEIRPFSAAGRMGRVRYIAYSFVAGLVVYIPIVLLSLLVGQSTLITLLPIVMIIVGLIALIIQVIFTIQRCHDFNSSGWLSLILLIPLAVFVFWFVPGTQGENRFGPPPPPNTKGVIAAAIGIPIVLIVLAGTLGTYIARSTMSMDAMDEGQLEELQRQLEQQQQAPQEQQEQQKDK